MKPLARLRRSPCCYVIVYDVSDDRRRERLATSLLDVGEPAEFAIEIVWRRDASRARLFPAPSLPTRIAVLSQESVRPDR